MAKCEYITEDQFIKLTAFSGNNIKALDKIYFIDPK